MTGDQTVMTLPIAEIGELDASDYVGLIEETAVECLTARIAAEGLLTPIWVRRNGNAAKKRWSVIAGRHRLLAATRLGWETIKAECRAQASSGSDVLRALQVAENLDRRTMRPIERALFIMDRWAIAASAAAPAEATNQQGRAIRARWSVLTTVNNTRAADISAVDEALANSSGDSLSTIRRYRKIYQKIVADLPDLYAQLNAHPLGVELSAMSTLASIRMADTRRQAAQALLSRLDWKSMEEVLVAAGIAASTGNRRDPNNHGQKMKDAWSIMPSPDRRAHVDWLAGEVTAGQAVSMVATFNRRGLLP